MPNEDANRNITLSLALTNNSTPSVESADGPHIQPIFQGLPYLNALNGPPMHEIVVGPLIKQAAIDIGPVEQPPIVAQSE